MGTEEQSYFNLNVELKCLVQLFIHFYIGKITVTNSVSTLVHTGNSMKPIPGTILQKRTYREQSAR